MTAAPPLPVLLDGDPGIDDAVAWFLALASSGETGAARPELEVLGFTAVHGNVGLPLTTRNTGVVLALAGVDTPYYAGADRPLVREAIFAASVHGESGLPTADLPEPTAGPHPEHAAAFMIRAARARPGEVTVVATGPLTNLALAFRLAPDLPGLLREVVWMGGSTGGGNRTPSAEFNALADPHAAQIVFTSGVPLRMVGLNVTMRCIATPERVAALRALGNRAGAASADLLTAYAAHYCRRYGLSGGALHDPLAVGAVLRPELLEWQTMRVDVELQDGLNLGRTVADLHGVSGQPANARVAVDVDDEGFFALLLERLARLA